MEITYNKFHIKTCKKALKLWAFSLNIHTNYNFLGPQHIITATINYHPICETPYIEHRGVLHQGLTVFLIGKENYVLKIMQQKFEKQKMGEENRQRCGETNQPLW